MRASRGEPRIPFPTRSVTRTASTCQGRVARATKGRAALATAYPKSTRGFRRGTRSATTPEASLSRLETVSAAPSTSPMYAGPAFSTSVRNTGRSGKIISVPTSVKRLVKPSRRTAAGSGRRRGSGALARISGHYTGVL